MFLDSIIYRQDNDVADDFNRQICKKRGIKKLIENVTDKSVTKKLIEIGDTHYIMNKRVEAIRKFQERTKYQILKRMQREVTSQRCLEMYWFRLKEGCNVIRIKR